MLVSFRVWAHAGTFHHDAHIYCRRLVWGLHLVLFSVPPALVRLHWEWPPAWFGWLNWRSWIWCKQRLENSPACVHFSLTPATAVRCQASLSGRDGTHTENKAHLSLASSQGTPRQPQMCEKARISRTAGLETVSDCSTTPLKSGAQSHSQLTQICAAGIRASKQQSFTLYVYQHTGKRWKKNYSNLALRRSSDTFLGVQRIHLHTQTLLLIGILLLCCYNMV